MLKSWRLPTNEKRFRNCGGVLDFYGNDTFIRKLFPSANYTRDQFSFQLSDQFPVGVQIKTDIDGARLDQIAQNSRKG